MDFINDINIAGCGINTLLSIVGVFFYFLWKVRSHIGNRFDFNLFKKDNRNAIIWSGAFSIMLNVVICFSPESVELILSFFGVSLNIIDGAVTNASPILIGAAVAAISRDMNKEKNG